MSGEVEGPGSLSGEVAPDGVRVECRLCGMLQCFKLVSTGLGEWLKRIFMSSGKNEISKLFPGYVRPEIVLEDMLYGLICGGNHQVG